MEKVVKTKMKIQFFLLVVVSVALSACANIKGPTWLTGEPDDSELVFERITRTPPSEKDPTWPRLADIPKEKPAFSTPEELARKAEELASERMKADAEKARLQSIDLHDRQDDVFVDTSQIEEAERMPELDPSEVLVEEEVDGQANTLGKVSEQEGDKPFSFSILKTQ